MIYRQAKLIEIPLIAELKLKMFKEVEMDHLLIDNFIVQVICTYESLYTNGQAQHFIVEENEKIVACAGAFIKEDIPYYFYKHRRYGFIGDVYVEPHFRQRGYARALTNAVIEWMTAQDIRTIRLLASHNARHLYESMDFKATDEMVLNI